MLITAGGHWFWALSMDRKKIYMCLYQPMNLSMNEMCVYLHCINNKLNMDA